MAGTSPVIVGLTDGGLIGFLGVVATIFAAWGTLYWQGRDQRRTLGTPNGGGAGSLAGDLTELRGEFAANVSELRGEVTERNRQVDRRLSSLDKGQVEILRRLPEQPRGEHV